MKVSDISTERLNRALNYAGFDLTIEEHDALIRAELSRRQADKGERQTCCQCNWSNGELLNMAHEANYKPEWWCHGCLHRLVNAHRDETGKFIKLTDTAKPKAEKVEPVVRYRKANIGDPIPCFDCGMLSLKCNPHRDSQRVI